MAILLGLLCFWIWWSLAGSNSVLDGDVDGRWEKIEARELAYEIVPSTLSKELTGVAMDFLLVSFLKFLNDWNAIFYPSSPKRSMNNSNKRKIIAN